MLTGNNGILKQAQRAKNETEETAKNEEKILDNYAQYIDGSTNGGTLTTVTGNETVNTEVYDSLGNKIVVPAGFKVVNPGDNVEDGIIIEDVSHGATAGSQFVWIPVGEDIKKSDGTTFDIKLGRNVFNEDGSINEELSKTEPEDELKTSSTSPYVFTEGLKKDTTNNIHAKDIKDFISKVNSKGGYYIGRYEARTKRSRDSKDNPLTQITVKSDDYVYNYVTQAQAAEESQKMYDNNNFTSDLINSYAFDTALDFFQKCDNRMINNSKPYSYQNSLNTSFAAQGTNNLEKKDIICNVFDIASNCLEWTTEMSDDIKATCVFRGGTYIESGYKPNSRAINYPDMSEEVGSFRPILYL